MLTPLVKKSIDPLFSISPVLMSDRKLNDDGCTCFPIHSTQADGTSSDRTFVLPASPPDIPFSPVLKSDDRASQHHPLLDTDVISAQCSRSIGDIPSAAIELARNLFLGEPSQADRLVSASDNENYLVRDLISSNHIETACSRENLNAMEAENVEHLHGGENVCRTVDPVHVESASASQRSDDALQSSFIDRGGATVVSSNGKSVSRASNEPSPGGRGERLIDGSRSHSEDEDSTERYDVVEMSGGAAFVQASSGQSSGVDNIVVTNLRTVTDDSSLYAFWVADSQSGPPSADLAANTDCMTSAKSAAVDPLLSLAVPDTPFNSVNVKRSETKARRSENFTSLKYDDSNVLEADEETSSSKAASARSRKGEKAKAGDDKTRDVDALFRRAPDIRRATRGGKHRMYKQKVLTESPKDSDSPPASGQRTVERPKFTGQRGRSSSERTGSKSSAAAAGKRKDELVSRVAAVALAATSEDSVSERVTRTLRPRANRGAKQTAAAADAKFNDDDSNKYPLLKCAAVNDDVSSESIVNIVSFAADKCDENEDIRNTVDDTSGLSTAGVSSPAGRTAPLSSDERARAAVVGQRDVEMRDDARESQSAADVVCESRRDVEPPAGGISNEACRPASPAEFSTGRVNKKLATERSRNVRLPSASRERGSESAERSVSPVHLGDRQSTAAADARHSSEDGDVTVGGRSRFSGACDKSGWYSGLFSRTAEAGHATCPQSLFGSRYSEVGMLSPSLPCAQRSTNDAASRGRRSSGACNVAVPTTGSGGLSPPSDPSRASLPTPKNSMPSYQPVAASSSSNDKTNVELVASQSQTQSRLDFDRIQVNPLILCCLRQMLFSILLLVELAEMLKPNGDSNTNMTNCAYGVFWPRFQKYFLIFLVEPF